MITFKPFSPDKPNVWQAYINKEPAGLLVEGETSKDAEQTFVRRATDGVRWGIDKERFDRSSKVIFDLETANHKLVVENKKLGEEVQALIQQRAELELTIQKMKTEAPAKKPKRLFGRRAV